MTIVKCDKCKTTYKLPLEAKLMPKEIMCNECKEVIEIKNSNSIQVNN